MPGFTKAISLNALSFGIFRSYTSRRGTFGFYRLNLWFTELERFTVMQSLPRAFDVLLLDTILEALNFRGRTG